MNIARLEDKLIVVCQEVGASVYDFDFDLHFTCSHPNILESEIDKRERDGDTCRAV